MMFGFDVSKLQKEIDRVYNDHYAKAGNQAVHDFYRAVIRRIRRYRSVMKPEIVRVWFIRNSREELVACMVIVLANLTWEVNLKIPNEIFNPDCMSAEVVK